MNDNIFSRSSRLAAITTSFHWRKQNKQWCSKKKKPIIIVKRRIPFLSINIYLFWLRFSLPTPLNTAESIHQKGHWWNMTQHNGSTWKCSLRKDLLKDKVIDDVFITQDSLLTTAFQLDCKGRHPGSSHPKGLIVKLITTFSRFALWYFKLYTKTACNRYKTWNDSTLAVSNLQIICICVLVHLSVNHCAAALFVTQAERKRAN